MKISININIYSLAYSTQILLRGSLSDHHISTAKFAFETTYIFTIIVGCFFFVLLGFSGFFVFTSKNISV